MGKSKTTEKSPEPVSAPFGRARVTIRPLGEDVPRRGWSSLGGFTPGEDNNTPGWAGLGGYTPGLDD